MNNSAFDGGLHALLPATDIRWRVWARLVDMLVFFQSLSSLTPHLVAIALVSTAWPSIATMRSCETPSTPPSSFKLLGPLLTRS